MEDIPTQQADDLDMTLFHSWMRKVARALNLNLRQVVSLPMSVADDMLGILFIFRSYAGTPTQNDYRLLQSFADQAAIAVHNARMYEFANQERQRLAAILDHSADGVMILDAQLHVERWNRALSRITGLDHRTGRRTRARRRDPLEAPRNGTRTLPQAIAEGWPHQL